MKVKLILVLGVSSKLGIEFNKGTEEDSGEETGVGNELDKYKSVGTDCRSRLRVDFDKYKWVDKTGVGVLLSGFNSSDVCRIWVELCTFNREVMVRVGSELVDSNEVDKGDITWVEFDLGEVYYRYIQIM